MSRLSVVQSLDAVETALSHFDDSLQNAGFADGAGTYMQMADVVLGQWLWVEETNQRDLEPRFVRIAELAQSVAHQLAPYVEAMQRLSALEGLAADRWGIEPSSPTGHVLGALAAAAEPMSLRDLGTATSVPASALRRALEDLVDAERVARVSDRGTRYVLSSSGDADLHR